MNILSLASYPRSGNTLLRSILWYCFDMKSASRYDDSELDSCEKLVGAMKYPAGLDAMNATIDRQGWLPLKTHHRDAYIGQYPTIYVVRDGRETCVSYWRYHRDLITKPETTLRQVIEGRVKFGGWSDHVKTWLDSPPERLLVLKYEDMVNYEWSGVIQIIAEFIDREPIRHTIPDFNQFQQAYPAFFRSGTNDTWPLYMSQEDLRIFDELHGETMEKMGYGALAEATAC